MVIFFVGVTGILVQNLSCLKKERYPNRCLGLFSPDIDPLLPINSSYNVLLLQQFYFDITQPRIAGEKKNVPDP